MKKTTVNDAIISVLRDSNDALTCKEICAKIIEKKYYEFKSENPMAIVSNAIRRHCFESLQAKDKKIFYKQRGNTTYELIK